MDWELTPEGNEPRIPFRTRPPLPLTRFWYCLSLSLWFFKLGIRFTSSISPSRRRSCPLPSQPSQPSHPVLTLALHDHGQLSSVQAGQGPFSQGQPAKCPL